MAKVDALLRRVRRQVQAIQRQPGVGGLALGLPEHDRELWRFGRTWLAEHGAQGMPTSPVPFGDGPDVMLATELRLHGGPAALIGDFVSVCRKEGRPLPHLVLTNIGFPAADRLPQDIRALTGIAAEHVSVLAGPSLEDRLDQLFARLLELRPQRLFLFHHADDPLAAAAAQPEVAGRTLLVHHTDAVPTLGLHVPELDIVELSPTAAAIARVQRLAPQLLLPTCPDPGPRPHGFLARGRLITAASGAPHQFVSDYVYPYADAVALILGTTGGWHLHFGALHDEALSEIANALRRAGVSKERFLCMGPVSSVGQAFWEHACDVFLAAFPDDDARSTVAAAASGTPCLQHCGQLDDASKRWALGLAGATTWRTWSELAAALRSLSDVATLEEKSRLIRDTYERLHHPAFFRRTLGGILADHGGLEDPDQGERDTAALRAVIGSLTEGIIAAGLALTELSSAIDGGLQELSGQIETLSAEAKATEQAMRRIDEQGKKRNAQALEKLRRLRTKLRAAKAKQRRRDRGRVPAWLDRWRRGKRRRD